MTDIELDEGTPYCLRICSLGTSKIIILEEEYVRECVKAMHERNTCSFMFRIFGNIEKRFVILLMTTIYGIVNETFVNTLQIHKLPSMNISMNG